MKLHCFLVLLACGVIELPAQDSKTVFIGVPSLSVGELATSRAVSEIGREKGLAQRCVISRIGDNYYWASRENAMLIRRDAGAFITFTPVDKNGYIRVIGPASKEVAAMLGPAESKFDYVEHLVVGLTSVTYWGRMESPRDALDPTN